MKILFVDSIPAAGIAMAGSLRKVLRLETLHAISTDGALKVLELQKDSIGVIVKFLDRGPEDAISFIQAVHEFSRTAAIRCPRVILHTPGDLSASYESRFRSIGAECLVYGYPKQLHATVRRLVFEAKCEKGRSTIILDRREGFPRFYVLGPTTREFISYGPRLIHMMNHLSINFGMEIPTETLAEVADITVRSVKVYLKRLRTGFEVASTRAGLQVSGEIVFHTFRKDGAFVHVLRARVLFV